MYYTGLFAVFILTTCCLASVQGVTMRRIYTLFTQEKTWNEAKQICADQFGQLVKIKGDRERHEITYLDQYAWGNKLSAPLLSGQTFWSGHHRPLTNSSGVKFQDCENFVPSVPFSTVDNHTCGSYNRPFALVMSPCNERKIFICERYEGDCWYQPVLNKYPSVTPAVNVLTGLQAIDCAVLCRNYTDNDGNDCWAFLYRNNQGDGQSLLCQFYYLNDAFVSTSGAAVSLTSASAVYSYDDNLEDMPNSTVDFIFYIRKCFEGSLDETAYPNYVNEGYYAETECATQTMIANSNNEQPPIPKPISSEAKAEELVKELTIQPSNTSAAQRKKTSAEDNRTSAISVGYVGVGLLVSVFGTLFFMDISRFVQAFKGIINALRPANESTV